MTKLIDVDDIHIVWNGGRRNGKTLIAEAVTKILEEIIEKTPAVDAEPVRHGEWIGYPECLQYENALTEEDCVCSRCGEVFNCIDNDMERFDYCPHCGAKMDGES